MEGGEGGTPAEGMKRVAPFGAPLSNSLAWRFNGGGGGTNFMTEQGIGRGRTGRGGEPSEIAAIAETALLDRQVSNGGMERCTLNHAIQGDYIGADTRV